MSRYQTNFGRIKPNATESKEVKRKTVIEDKQMQNWKEGNTKRIQTYLFIMSSICHCIQNLEGFQLQAPTLYLKLSEWTTNFTVEDTIEQVLKRIKRGPRFLCNVFFPQYASINLKVNIEAQETSNCAPTRFAIIIEACINSEAHHKHL